MLRRAVISPMETLCREGSISLRQASPPAQYTWSRGYALRVTVCCALSIGGRLVEGREVPVRFGASLPAGRFQYRFSSSEAASSHPGHPGNPNTICGIPIVSGASRMVQDTWNHRIRKVGILTGACPHGSSRLRIEARAARRGLWVGAFAGRWPSGFSASVPPRRRDHDRRRQRSTWLCGRRGWCCSVQLPAGEPAEPCSCCPAAS